ncbi:MAG: hypothetical protein ACLUQ6_03920 [Alistipes onderdonkii]
MALIWRQYIPLGPQQALRALQRDAALRRRHAGTLRRGLPVKGHLPADRLYLLARHFAARHRRLASPRHNMAVEVNVGVMGISYSHTKQVHNQGDGRQARRQHDELQSQYLLDRARHGILSLNTART